MEDIVFWVMVASKFVINVVALNDAIATLLRNWMPANFYTAISDDPVIVDAGTLAGN